MSLVPFSLALGVLSNNHNDQPTNYKTLTQVTIKQNKVGTPLASIFLDAEGATPISNPATTSERGVLDFYIEAGEYIAAYEDSTQMVSSKFVVGSNDHSKLSNLDAVGAHDAIYPRIVSCIKSLSALDGSKVDGQKVSVTGFYAGTTVGGGDFIWDTTKDKANHNGGTIIAPEAITAWDGTKEDLTTLLNWSGVGIGAFVRENVEFITPEQFGAVGNSTDLYPIFQAMNGTGDNVAPKKVVMKLDESYYISQASGFNDDIDLDLNRSTVVAPNGFLSIRKTIESYTGGNYFTTTKYSKTFELPTGVTVEVGDVLLFESNDVRQSVGNYLHGQFSYVERVNGSVVTISHQFYDTFTVDRIYRRKAIVARIYNGTVDISGASYPLTGLPTTGIYMSGWKCTDEDIHIIGGDHAGTGISSEGIHVRSENFTGYNVLNRHGREGADGRFGYGHLGAGCDVVINNASVRDCKHNLITSNRTFVTLSYVVNNPTVSTPAGLQNELTDQTINSSLGSQPIYQSMIDAHSNCIKFVVNDPELSGGNTGIAVRNGYAVINNPVFNCAGCTNQFRMDMLINIYESEAKYVEVNNPILRFSPIGSSALPRLVGIQAYYAYDHGTVIINNPDIDHGSFFWMATSSNSTVAANTNLNELIIRGARGRTPMGVQITGSSSQNIGNIGKITYEIEDLKIFRAYGYDGVAIDLRYFREFERVVVNGYVEPLLDMTGISGAGIATALNTVQIGETDSDSILGRLDLDNLEIRANNICVRVATSSNVPAKLITARKCNFDSGVGGDGNFAPAFYTSLAVLPEERMILDNSRFWVNKSGLSNSEAIRHVLTTKYSIDNCIINTSLSTSTSFTEMDSPVGLRRYDTSSGVEQFDTLISSSHSLYVRPNGDLLHSGTPSLPAVNGTYIYERSPSVGSPFVYAMAGGAWVVAS
jgi:hypothetical protein